MLTALNLSATLWISLVILNKRQRNINGFDTGNLLGAVRFPVITQIFLRRRLCMLGELISREFQHMIFERDDNGG